MFVKLKTDRRAMNERQGVKSAAGRIVSIDVLRGFDMLLLCGGAAGKLMSVGHEFVL